MDDGISYLAKNIRQVLKFHWLNRYVNKIHFNIEKNLTLSLYIVKTTFIIDKGLKNKVKEIGDIKMNHGIEIRWHGRGGQGAKTAALLLADVAFKTGAYVQGFPEYGPERMGAPITAYNRISRDEIRVHSNIYTPDLVVVVDETLLESVDVTAGLKENGAIIVNTSKSEEEIIPHLKGYKGAVYTVDARAISQEALGKYFPNSPMLAAAVAVSGVMDQDKFIHEMRASYQHKFAKKPEVIDGNMKALNMTLEALKEKLERSSKLSA